MLRIMAAAVVLLGHSSGALAEEDYMEVQRCIWRCLADSRGADDPAYHRCVARMCNGEPAPTASKPRRSEGARGGTQRSREGEWVYGRHPTLGLSAHVTMGGEAYGIACNRERPEQSGNIAVRRMTKGLMPQVGEQGGAITVYSDPYIMGGTSSYDGSKPDYFEEVGDICTLSLDNLRRASSVVYLKGGQTMLQMEGDNAVMTIKRGAESVRIANQHDLDAAGEKVVIPLKGSSKALARLFAACPEMQQQQDTNWCDPGD